MTYLYKRIGPNTSPGFPGNVAPSNTLPVGEWLPSHPGYDFLAMIDKDKNKQEAAHDRFHQLRNDDPLPALNGESEPGETMN